jgi:hypothetical protein
MITKSIIWADHVERMASKEMNKMYLFGKFEEGNTFGNLYLKWNIEFSLD